MTLLKTDDTLWQHFITYLEASHIVFHTGICDIVWHFFVPWWHFWHFLTLRTTSWHFMYLKAGHVLLHTGQTCHDSWACLHFHLEIYPGEKIKTWLPGISWKFIKTVTQGRQRSDWPTNNERISVMWQKLQNIFSEKILHIKRTMQIWQPEIIQ